MRRRDFIVMAAGAVGGWSYAARAQQTAMPVIGYLSISERETDAPLVAAFLAGLAEAGYVEGQSVAIEYRWAEGRYERVRPLIGDLVRCGVNAIVTSGGKSVPPRQKTRLRRFQSFLSPAAIRSRAGWLPASAVQVAI